MNNNFAADSAGDTPVWECTKCRERIEDSFDACWKCGTSMEGIEDPSFRAADDDVLSHGDATASPASVVPASGRMKWQWAMVVGAGLFLLWVFATKHRHAIGANPEQIAGLWVLTVLLGSLVGGLAARKGYNFFIWFFAAGIIGLIVLAFLPFVNKGGLSPEVAEDKRTAGNMIGAVLAAVTVVTVLRFFAGE
jgi:hypothetical protein